jgi:Ca-activated chloride channel family protein
MPTRNSILIIAVLAILNSAFAEPSRAQDAGNVSAGSAQGHSADAAGGETVYFLALDSHGEPVSDLKAEELIVRVNGKPVEVARLIPPEAEPPLTLDVLLDVSGSRRDELPGVEQKYAYDFFAALLRPEDRAFVWEFDDRVSRLTSSPDASDPKALARGVAKEREGRGPTTLFDAIVRAPESDLQNVSGRKAVLTLTDGDDNSSVSRARDAEDVVQREGIQFFAINVGPAASERSPADLSKARKVLKSLADASAGGSTEEVATKTEFHDALDRVQEYLRNEYAVTVALPPDVSWRRPPPIEIQTSKPGVTIIGPQEIREIETKK